MSNVANIRDDDQFKRVDREDGPVIGQWYWVTPDQDFDPVVEATYNADTQARLAEDRKEWLGCAMKMGTNFVEIESPHNKGRYNCERIHLENFWTELKHEPNADAIIRQRIGEHQQESVRLMQEVQDLTARLGMAPTASAQDAQGASGGALMALSGTHDVKAYGIDLVRAKDEQLPALFKAIEEANEGLATWMKAPTMPMLAALAGVKNSIEDIDDRIFSVKLYAGLTEDVVKCCEGQPAQPLDKLHVMQRMTYMDEECLANYRHGGMEFEDIGEFDEFMCDPVNRDRILPFPRCLIAMRVRRKTKDRDSEGSIAKIFVNLELEAADRLTFLYIRNGDQVWRLSCDLNFGKLIFPDKSVYDPTEAKMMKTYAGSVDSFMSVSNFEDQLAAHEEKELKSKAWEKSNPGSNSWMDNPYRNHFGFRPCEWAPMDHSNVYFDEAMTEIGKKIKEYNRVALIIQGLFDRSLVLHPHPPVQTWSQGGFDKAVKLVYDGSDTIAWGEAPDFEAYRARCNASMRVGSMAVGQEIAWLTKEAEKEGARRDRDWRNKSDYRPTTFKPYGNPGPGYVARVDKLSKKGATFTWTRKRLRGDRWDSDSIPCTITVPASELFHVDAYQLGDYKQFFTDSRTRAQYLKWAPLLLAAEERLFERNKSATE